jgi:hypothetical protein
MNIYIRSLSKITLKQYCDYKSAVDDIERAIVATGLNREKVLALKMESIKKICEVFNEIISHEAQPLEQKIKVKIGLRSMKLAFIPDLQNMTAAEYIDMDECGKMVFQNKKGADYSYLIKLMAVLYRPIKEAWGDNYNLIPYDAAGTRHYMKYIEALPMDKVFGGLFFFSSLETKLQQGLSDYLAEQMTMAKKEINQA